jgi:hypothetical protein
LADGNDNGPHRFEQATTQQDIRLRCCDLIGRWAGSTAPTVPVEMAQADVRLAREVIPRLIGDDIPAEFSSPE